MANNIATPLERQFMQINGLELVTSQSTQGHVALTLQFALDKSIDAAATDVQTAISQATGSLPVDLPSPPTYSKTNPNDQPIMYIALTSDSVTPGQLYDYGSTQVGQRISILPGVSSVNVFGTKSAVRIKVDPSAMWARGISIDDLNAAIKNGTSYTGAGQFDGVAGTALLRPNGQLESAQSYGNLIVSSNNGAPVYLRDVAQAVDSVQDERISMRFWVRGYPMPSATVVVAVNRQAGSNAVAVAKSVRDLLPMISAELPGSVRVTPIYDRSQTIVHSVDDVEATLLIAFVLVVVVIFMFPGTRHRYIDSRRRAAAVAAAHVHGDAAAGVQPGQPLADGADAGDRVPRRRRYRFSGKHRPPDGKGNAGARGHSPKRKGNQLHDSFDDDFAGGGFLSAGLHVRAGGPHLPRICRHHRRLDFRFRYGFADAYAADVRKAAEDQEGTASSKIGSSAPLAGSKSVCSTSTADRSGGFCATAGSPRSRGLCAWRARFLLFMVIPKAFLPVGDSGFIWGVMIGKEGSSPQQMQALQNQADAVLQQDPAVGATFTMTGNNQFLASNQGLLLAFLRPTNVRSPIQEVAGRMMARLGAIPGVFPFLRPMPVLNISTGATNQNQGQYAYALSGVDSQQVYDVAQKLMARLMQFPGFATVSSDYFAHTPNLEINIQRDQARTYGVSETRILTLLRNAYSQNYLYLIKKPEDQYQVILEVKDSERSKPEDLGLLYIKSDDGKNMVPLSALVTWKKSLGTQSVNHLNQFTSVTIFFNLKPGVPIGDATDFIGKAEKEIVPPTVRASLQGEALTFQDTIRDLTFLMGLAVFIMYVILAILYESYVHPLTVLSTLPTALVGGLLTLYLFGQEASLYAFVGMFMLMGIVKKNGIMIVDFARQRTDAGETAEQAIHDASMDRFRPIIMTTLAAVIGAVPIAAGYGADGASRRPLGMVIVGGLVVSQFITLYVTPVIYLYLEEFQTKVLDRTSFFHSKHSAVPSAGGSVAD